MPFSAETFSSYRPSDDEGGYLSIPPMGMEGEVRPEGVFLRGRFRRLMGALISSLFLLSCSSIKYYTDLEILTDKRVLEVLGNRSGHIDTMRASMNLTPAIGGPDLDAYLSYRKGGVFRLTGLAPNGLTLFVFETEDNRFLLSFPDGRSIRGDMDEFMPVVTGIPGLEFVADLGIAREVIDFYGGDLATDASFFIEELEGHYILTQLSRGEEGLSYPLRRWWIEKGDMNIVRKEIYSMRHGNSGGKLFEALYGDFRVIDGIKTPYYVMVRDGKGRRLLKIRFRKVEYNK